MAHHTSTGRITVAVSRRDDQIVEPESCHREAARPPPLPSQRMVAPTSEDAGAGTEAATSPFSEDWRERIIFPAAAAGVAGAAFGLLLGHRARLGAARAAVTYAANLAIVAGCYGGGHFGAVKYAVSFAAAGTALDYAAVKLAPEWHSLKEYFSGKKDWFTLPEWSPIQVLDEEALAKKKAREEKLFAQRALGKLDKEKP
ncbi:hypothetical protein BS78_06G057600 [Paspalum vaginatum]|nr:hypothetical protein BS78_06G057600 [Paspalum vaginatum]